MFRQKIAQVTNCSCRLLPNQADDYMIFKPSNINAKPLIKQPKEKFSLKTQTGSSTKHQNKVTSAQKTSLKLPKTTQQQKISVSGNMQVKKQKLQKNLICSPENSHIRKLNQNPTQASNYSSQHPTFPKTQHGIKTAQNNRFRQQRNPILNSYNQGQTNSHQKKNILVSNFGNNRYQNYKDVSSKITEIPKRSLNFEQYYKHISNPYAINDRNKENAFGGGNGLKVKIDLKAKKEMRKMKNQVLPLQELHLQANSDVYCQQLGNYHGDKIGQSRANFNGSLTTKNSFNSQNSQKESLRGSQNNMFSMMNSKVSLIGGPNIRIQNFLDAQSYQQSTQSQLITHRTPFNQPITRKQLRNHLLTQVQAVSDDEDLNLSRMTQRMNLAANHNFASTQNPNPQPLFPIDLTEVNPQKVIIQKISTLAEMMNNSAQCQSVVGQGSSSCCESNENSVVVMRYKDLIEPLEESSHFVLKPEDLLLDQKPGHEKHSQMMTDSSNVFTSVKPQGRMHVNLVDDSLISANDYLKKTVKVTKQYRTHNFNMLE